MRNRFYTGHFLHRKKHTNFCNYIAIRAHLRKKRITNFSALTRSKKPPISQSSNRHAYFKTKNISIRTPDQGTDTYRGVREKRRRARLRRFLSPRIHRITGARISANYIGSRQPPLRAKIRNRRRRRLTAHDYV